MVKHKNSNQIIASILVLSLLLHLSSLIGIFTRDMTPCDSTVVLNIFDANTFVVGCYGTTDHIFLRLAPDMKRFTEVKRLTLMKSDSYTLSQIAQHMSIKGQLICNLSD